MEIKFKQMADERPNNGDLIWLLFRDDKGLQIIKGFAEYEQFQMPSGLADCLIVAGKVWKTDNINHLFWCDSIDLDTQCPNL